MAKVSGAIVGISVVFLLILTVCNTLESKDSNYETYNVFTYLPNLNSYHSDIRIKRQAIETTTTATSSSSSLTPTSSTLATTSIVQTNQTGVNDGDMKKSTYRDRPLLGVNGTGQRKDTFQIKVSEPINPVKSSTVLSITTTNGSTVSTMNSKDNVDSDDEVDDGVDDLNGNFTKTLNFDNIDKTDADTNSTLLQHNITNFKENYHTYYNSTLKVSEPDFLKYWNELNESNLSVSNLLSKSHRRAMTIKLSFDFPFFGHPIRNVTVATGGFIYTGDYVHSWLAATQYIAPLMANFDTSLSNDSFIKFSDNGTVFTVVWENVKLQDRPEIGAFTFSASLFNTGDIVLAYSSIPMRIEAIHDDRHPVKVGLSDAYIIDKTIFFSRRKTIYEYERVTFGSEDIQNNTLVFLTAQPTCLEAKDCVTCVTEFKGNRCVWCPTLNRCSTGMDRKRQEWLQKGCDKVQLSQEPVCPTKGKKGNNASGSTFEETYPEEVAPTEASRIVSSLKTEQSADENTGFGMMVSLVLPIGLVLIAVLWIFYAYRNPHTKSGQLLIQYRPSQWKSWKRGEARYTAATIHM